MEIKAPKVNSNVNIALRLDVKKRYSNFENQKSIAEKNDRSRERIRQLINQLFTKEEIKAIKKEIKLRVKNANNLKNVLPN